MPITSHPSRRIRGSNWAWTGKPRHGPPCDRTATSILAERYRVAHGEVDIVARDDQTIVFIEVKTRRADAYGGGAAAVTWRKQRTIVRVAEAFLARGRLAHLPCRFDVVSVDWPPGEGPRAEIIRGAFDAR